MGFDLSSELKTSPSEPVKHTADVEVQDNVTEPATATDPKKITPGTIRFNK